MTTLWLTVRWTLTRILSRPLTWILWAALTGLWIGLAVATPLGISTRDHSGTAPGTDVAFVGLLLGSLAALPTLATLEPLLVRATFLRRETTLLLVTATTLVLFLLAASFGPVLQSSSPLRDPTGLGMALLHCLVLMSLVFRAPLTTTWRSLLLVFLAWFLPAVLDGPGQPSRLLRVLLDPAQHLSTTGSPGGTVLPTMAAPILVLWALSALAPRPSRRPISP